MLFINKPYLWLNNDGTRKIVYMKLWCDNGFGLPPNLSLPGPSVMPVQTINGTTLELKYKVLSGYHTPELVEFDLTASYSKYSNHENVKVSLIDDTNKVLGWCTIKPVKGEFYATPNLPYLIPFLWLEGVENSGPIVHIAALVPANSTLKMAQAKPVSNKLYVNYDLTPGGANASFMHDKYTVGTYQPPIQDIIVGLNEPAGDKRRGSGTVHTSEADASK